MKATPDKKKRQPVLEEGGEYRIRDKYHQYRLATKDFRDRPYVTRDFFPQNQNVTSGPGVQRNVGEWNLDS